MLGVKMCVRETGQSHPSIAAGSVIWCLKEVEPRDLCNDWCHLIWCTVLKHGVASAGGTKRTISGIDSYLTVASDELEF